MPQGESAECEESFVRRVVWNGAAILDEIQAQGDSTATASEMENDTISVALPLNSQYMDPNPYYGIVAYTYGGLGTDLSLAATRINYRDLPYGGTSKLWAPFSVSPIWNPRGQPIDGTYADGTTQHDGGLAICETSACTRYAGTPWPLGWFAYDRPKFVRWNWFGSLLEDQQDKSGTLYRRARQYDPSTGRFTQEDPLGLAGGLNAYGFANGDPVNYGDPFGLCPPHDNDFCFGGNGAFSGGGGGSSWGDDPQSAGPATTESKSFFSDVVAGVMISDTKLRASELRNWAHSNGWEEYRKNPGGPIRFRDDNGVDRITLKKGSRRTPGSEQPHAEFRNSKGERVNASGQPVNRRSPGNHTPIVWDIPEKR